MAFSTIAKIQVCCMVLFLLILGSYEESQKISEAGALTSARDTAFWQEYHEAYPVSNEGENEVRSIAVDLQGNAWIATGSGVFTKKADNMNWLHAIPEAEQGPSFSVVVDDQSAVWMSTWNNVYRFKDNKLERMSGAVAPVSTLAVASEGIYALGPNGVWLYSEEGCTKKNYNIARSVRDATSDNQGGLWVASDVGLYQSTSKATKHFVKSEELISAYIRGVAMNGEAVWAAGLGGVTIIQHEKKNKVLRPEDGIPSVNVNCIKRSTEGVMWVGTDAGVVRYRSDGSHSLLFSRRWLLDDKVNDIAFDQ